MKKTISFFLALIMVCACFAFQSPDANALGAVWVKEFYKDKFGDKTNQYYLTNKSQFKGTYNSDSASNGKLGANLIFERDVENLLVYVTLSLKGKDQVKNGTSANKNYDISVKKADGSQFTTSGTMRTGENRISIRDTTDIAAALISADREISIYIEESGKSNNNYLFQAKSGNFRELYQQEIYNPYLADQYQKGEQLLASKQYDEAISVFEAISGYKDSEVRAKEAAEAKNADAYEKAEDLLTQKRFDESAKAFRALGDYRDSAARIEDVVEAKNADAYEKAEDLLTQKRFDESVEAFRALGDYRDSAARIEDVIEAKNADAYEKAEGWLEAKKYEAAAEAFRALSGYRDSNSRVDEVIAKEKADEDAYAAAEELLKQKQYDDAILAFQALGAYIDSASRVNEVKAARDLDAEAYLKAEKLLEQKRFDDAYQAFRDLGEYKDSQTRKDEVLEAKKADAYLNAEKLLEQHDYDEAIEAFKALGAYGDSRGRVEDAIEMKKASQYEVADSLYQEGNYQDAYQLFSEIKGYKDLDERISNDRNLQAIRNEIIKPYKTVGSIVFFGTYEQDGDITNGEEKIEWIVLDNKGNKSLLFSKVILDLCDYGSCGAKDWPVWENSNLRKWLNSSFLYSAFTLDERSAIVFTDVDNSVAQGNRKFEAPGSNNTEDQIFALSFAELNKYLKNKEDRQCSRSRAVFERDSDYSCWWLRSPGYWHENVMAVNTYSGSIEDTHNPRYFDGVRPAFWIDVDSDFF